jgi:hypothetical protein
MPPLVRIAHRRRRLFVRLEIPKGRGYPNLTRAESGSLHERLDQVNQEISNYSKLTGYWEIIADNLSKAGWSWGCVSGEALH